MIRVISAVSLLVAVAGCTGRRDAAYEFTELVYPGAESTVASDMNDAGHVVGWYDQDGRTNGFLLKDGKYSAIQYPGASLTQVYGIAENGDLAGGFRMPDETNSFAYHGFVLTAGGVFRPISHPDYQYGMAMRILGDGSIVGCYHKEEGIPSMRGMTVPADAISEAGVTPAAVKLIAESGSMHNGATPDGTKVVGVLSERGDAYVIDRGVLSTFTAPGAKRTEAWDINASGTIVGVFVDSESVSHGFVREDERYRTLDYPDAKGTVIFGINAAGDLVGGFQAADGTRRGYIARRK